MRKLKQDEVHHRLIHSKPFTYMRWGDGDMFCAIGSSFGIDSNGFDIKEDNRHCQKLREQLLKYGQHHDSNL